MSRWLCRLHDTFMSFAGGRPGRTLEQKQKLIKQIVASWTEIQMDYGLILPRPGNEPAWFADNAAALDGI